MSERSGRARSTRWEMARHLAACLSLAVLGVLGVVVAGWRPRVEYILALAALAAVATVALQRLGSTTVEAMWPSPFPPNAVVPGVDNRINSLETLLRRSAEDHIIFERRLRPLLRDLAAHRLRRGHGVDLATQPDDARRLLGPENWLLVTAPADRPVAAARIERAVAAIERLETEP